MRITSCSTARHRTDGRESRARVAPCREYGRAPTSLGLVDGDVLGVEPLLQDVHHLAPHIDDQDRHAVVRHGRPALRLHGRRSRRHVCRARFCHVEPTPPRRCRWPIHQPALPRAEFITALDTAISIRLYLYYICRMYMIDPLCIQVAHSGSCDAQPRNRHRRQNRMTRNCAMWKHCSKFKSKHATLPTRHPGVTI